MPRQGITREQVFEAAEHLTQAGENPTWRAVRDHLGSGSPNTIGRHLAAWKEEHAAVQAETVPIPEPVENALHRVWGLALKQAQDQLRGDRQALDADREAFERDRAEFSSEIDRLDTAVEQAQGEKQKAVEALDAEREAHRQTREELQKARDLAKEQEQELGALRAKIKQDDQAELRKIGERLEQLEQRLPPADAQKATTTVEPVQPPEKSTRKSTGKTTTATATRQTE